MRITRLALSAVALAATFAAPAVAGPEVPEIGACRMIIPMQYPDVVDDVIWDVYDAAPPVRDAVWTVCAL